MPRDARGPALRRHTLVTEIHACPPILRVAALAGLLVAFSAQSVRASSAPAFVTNLQGWWDASNASTVTTSGGSITAIADLSGNGYTITDTTGQPPLLATANLNGLNTIDISTLGQELATSASFGGSGSAARTLITVQNSGVVNTGTDNCGQAFGIDMYDSPYFLPYQYCADNFVSAWSSSNADSWHILVAERSTSAATGYADGTQMGSAVTTTIDTVPSALTIGTRTPGDGLETTGYFAEILYYSRALTDPEREYLEGYLACKWGLEGNLPATHPWKSACPNLTVGLTLALVESVSGAQSPGTTVTYTTTFTNAAGIVDYNPVFTRPIPTDCDYQVGSTAFSLGTTELSGMTVTYSSDGSTYGYTPVSGGGGAASSYDRNVKVIRWTASGGLAPGAPNNTGTVSFTAKIQ